MKTAVEEVRKVKRTELFKSILSIVKQIPRKDVEGDAMDAPSCAYEIEQLFLKWQQEQDKKMYSKEEVIKAHAIGMDYYAEPNDWDKVTPKQKLENLLNKEQ